MSKKIVIRRPQAGEFDPAAAAYIAHVPGENILATLETQASETIALLSTADGDLRYAPGKWSVKEVVGHISDSERIFAYRALRIARNDPTPLAGFEQDDYMRFSPFAQCPLSDLIEEFAQIRRSTLSLFRSLDEAAWLRRGMANQHAVTVGALAYIIAGHELHHRKILQERYFAGSR